MVYAWITLALSMVLYAGGVLSACDMAEVCGQCDCSPDNKTVTCDQLHVQGKGFFPLVCETVTELTILTSDIIEINDTDMSNLINLKTFKLSNSPLENISENAFGSLKNLEILSIEHVNVSQLLPNTFLGLSKIQQITFADSLLVNISLEHFSHLNGTLHILNLSQNKIVNILGGLFNASNNLTRLDLSHNSLTTLDNMTLQFLSQVTDLSVERNYLVAVASGAIDGMTSLKTLNLAGNLLSSLLGDLFINSSVQTLNISDNLFSVIPIMSISKMDNLKVLDLNGNILIEITKDAFVSLYKLTELHLSRLIFLISVDDGSFAIHSELEKLYLSHNPQLVEIHPNAFSVSLPSLKELYINDNALTAIPEDMFNGTVLSGLEVVEAQGNPLLCSCDVIWMMSDMEDPSITWIQPWKDGDKAVTCKSPQRFNGTKVYDTDIATLTCDAPVILKEDQFLETNNENFYMEVIVTGGLPTTKWITVSGKTLENGDKLGSESGNDVISVSEEIYTNNSVISHLFINHPTYKSKGYYTFVAVNAGGTIQKQYLATPPNLPISKGKKAGLIAGLVVGALVVLALVGVLVYVARKKPYKRMQEEREGEEGGASDQPTYGSVDRLVNETETAPSQTEVA